MGERKGQVNSVFLFVFLFFISSIFNTFYHFYVQNKYYPPDYDPRAGGLNKFLGTHALRERARKIHLGIIIIRFEMPYNIWCDGCKNHIGMGVSIAPIFIITFHVDSYIHFSLLIIDRSDTMLKKQKSGCIIQHPFTNSK